MFFFVASFSPTTRRFGHTNATVIYASNSSPEKSPDGSESSGDSAQPKNKTKRRKVTGRMLEPKSAHWRRCVACKDFFPQADLFRIVRAAGPEHWQVSFVGFSTQERVFGRSTYFCKTESCIKKAERKDMASRGLGAPIDKSFFSMARQHLASLKEKSSE